MTETSALLGKHDHTESVQSNTQRAYASDWKGFVDWCHIRDLKPLPASAETLALYLADIATTLKLSTVQRKRSSISTAHRLKDFKDPGVSPQVRRLMKELRNTSTAAVVQKKSFSTEDLQQIAECVDLDGVRGVRDLALVLIGFAGGLRGSELIALDAEDLERNGSELRVVIRQPGMASQDWSETINITTSPFASADPVTALDRWLEEAKIVTGPIWRPVNRHGQILERRLTPQSVTLIVKDVAECAGLDPKDYSGLSLRSENVRSL